MACFNRGSHEAPGHGQAQTHTAHIYNEGFGVFSRSQCRLPTQQPLLETSGSQTAVTVVKALLAPWVGPGPCHQSLLSWVKECGLPQRTGPWGMHP